MVELKIAHAIEKVTFRLGLESSGQVSVARIFVEFPLAIGIIDEILSELADGRTLLKDEVGEYNGVHFPEYESFEALQNKRADCPVCGGAAPSSVSVGGVEMRAPLLCDVCYRSVARMAQPEAERGALSKLKKFFTEDEPDLMATVRMEHEVFFHALALGGQDLTHTAIAAQTRYPMADVKECLNNMGARRYVRYGLTRSGESVAYSLPAILDYPEPHFRRFLDTYTNVLTAGIKGGAPAPHSASRLPGLRRRNESSASQRSVDVKVKRGGSTLSSSSGARGISISTRPKGASRRPAAAANNDDGSLKIVVKKNKEDEAEADSGAVRITLKPSTRRSSTLEPEPTKAAEPAAPDADEGETASEAPERSEAVGPDAPSGEGELAFRDEADPIGFSDVNPLTDDLGGGDEFGFAEEASPSASRPSIAVRSSAPSSLDAVRDSEDAPAESAAAESAAPEDDADSDTEKPTRGLRPQDDGISAGEFIGTPVD